jgi:FlaA1/EpsC-like NDP-sugar epimerase
MKRFFMTIPEASQLILRAGALGKSGEAFVLDMGEQVRIVDLANDLIRLSGYEAGRDIDVAYVGLRRGEKLEEELFFPEEKSDRTIDERIFVVRSSVGSTVDDYSEQMSRLEAATQRNDEPGVATVLRQLTEELQQSESV